MRDDNDNEATYYYFNWWGHQTQKWNYEVYFKEIKDFAQIDTREGYLYSILAFTDSIQISRFFQNWSYGSRFTRVFDKDDVNLDAFCPENIITNPRDKDYVWVLSNCDGAQNLISF